MKKVWNKLAILLCLLTAFGVLFSACKKDDDDDDDYSAPPTAAPTSVLSVSVADADGKTSASTYVGGAAITLTATISPAAATNKNVTWSVENASAGVVELAANKLTATVTPKKAGKETITVKTADGEKTASYTVQVYESEAAQTVITEVSGAYTAGETTISIAEDGTVTVGESSGDAAVTKNANGTYTVTTTVGGTDYVVTVNADGEISAVTAGGQDVTSSFEKAKVALVKADGTNVPYTKIQDALKAIPSNTSDTYTIKLEPGDYEELIYYKGSATVILSGQGTAEHGTDVVIKYSNSGNTNKMASELGVSGGYLRSVARFDGSANVVLENLTIQNTYKRADGGGSDTQAEALLFHSTGHLAAYNCSFLSHQDTIQTEGKAWFYDCYVEGDVDFTWIEHTAAGSVALYENCTLKALGEEVGGSAIRFAAPRLIGTTANIGKGEVFLNSTFDSDGQGGQIYLARSVASGTDVDQAAFINSTATEALKAKLTAPWEKTPFMLTGVPRTIIGWKMDSTSAAAFGYTSELTGDNADILSETAVKNEFSGRRAVLNRVYNVTAGKYKRDYDSYWDVDTLYANRGWKVDADTSSVFVADEDEVAVVTYDTTKEISEYKELISAGFEREINTAGNIHWVGQKDATLTIPVTGKALITVVGYYKGNGTIGFNGQGDALYAFNTGNTSSTLEKAYVNYTGAGNVVITATETTYITKIKVEYDKALTFVPVTAITISAQGDATTVVGKKTLQLSAALTPSAPTNSDVVWSVDDEDAATIDQTGLLTAANVKEEKTVVVTCTSKDAKAVKGTYSLTVEVAAETSFDIQWLDTEAHCAVDKLDATNGNENIATGGRGTASDVSSKWSAGWKTDINRATAGYGCIVVSTSDNAPVPAGYDTFYVDFPITAKVACAITSVTLGGANWGTGNVKSQISYKRANDSEYTVVATGLVTRQITSTLETPAFITLAANETITLRIAAGAATEQKGGRSPGVPTVIVNGEIPPEAGKLYSYSLSSSYDADNLVSESLSSDSVKNLVSADGFFTLQANSFNGTQHGVVMKDSTFTVKVLPGAVVSMYACAYSNAGEVTVTSDVDETLSEKVTIAKGTENEIYSYTYTGKVMATLTFTYPNATNYLHKVTVQD